MASQFRSSSRRSGRKKKTPILIPALATGALFAVVLLAAVMIARRPGAETPNAAGRTPHSLQPASTAPAPSIRETDVASLLAASSDGARTPGDDATDRQLAPAVDAKGKAAKVDASNPRDLVAAHLAAGEFGPASAVAAHLADADEQAHLFQMIADAQIAAGEFDAARTAIRRIPVPQERARANSRRATRQTLAGGAGAPDFQSLIDLIQQETSGPWFDVDGTGGTISEYATGVRVDPNGLMHRLTREEETGRLEDLGLRARVADLNQDMARSTPLRLVSLTRLEKEVARRLEQGQSVVATMKHLAGLSSVRYVFVYPEEGEIVIGGPAEGWRYDHRGLPRGVESGRPTLQLDDLVTVLRTFSPEGEGIFGCLIVPRQENMKALESYVAKSNARGPLPAGGAVRNWVRRLQELLGEQDVVVNGIPLDSRAARVIVEADYRMKLIGIDKLQGGDVRSYFDLLPTTGEATPTATVGLRWWLEMKYDALLHSPRRDVFEVQGSSVLCLSEDEKITPEGQRIHTGQSSPANRLFAQEFTNQYAQLAQDDVVFADLQNVFDLALLAALIQNERLDERSGWDRGVFAADGEYQTARFEPPKTVMSAANHRVYNGRDIVVQVAGGVRGDLMSVVKDERLVQSEPRLENFVERGKAPPLPHGRWWWDAAE